MFGTVGRMRIKPGKVEDLVKHFMDPAGTGSRGFRGSHVLVSEDGDEAVVAVLFEDKDSYFEMVHDPRTEAAYPRLLELVEGEPEWTDGEWRSLSPS
ncbi:MAG TPA: antibiotic biosynthesis monooxygenase [Actinomycetota bacterium]